MECPSWPEVSASLDGEVDELTARRAAAHVESCPQCGALTADVLVMLGSPRSSGDGVPTAFAPLSAAELRWFHGRSARGLLALVGIVIVAIAIPEFLTAGNAVDAHAVRHLATWQAGFGIGLVVAATISRLAQALLALAISVAVLTVVATIIDVVAGHRGPLAEAPHLVELVGIGLLWWLAPPHIRRTGRLARSEPREHVER